MQNYHNNKVHIIENLYKLGGLWVFNNDFLGLKAEPFVYSATKVLDDILSKTNLKNKKNPSIIFGEELPEWDAEFIQVEDLGGAYTFSFNGKIFWLCPVIKMFFNPVPQKFYIKYIESKVKPEEIAIIVKGGRIQSVLSSSLELSIQIKVLDYDNYTCGERDLSTE